MNATNTEPHESNLAQEDFLLRLREVATEDALLRLGEVLKRVPISRAAWYRLVASGEAPAPVHLGRTALWRASAISAWIASLKT